MWCPNGDSDDISIVSLRPLRFLHLHMLVQPNAARWGVGQKSIPKTVIDAIAFADRGANRHSRSVSIAVAVPAATPSAGASMQRAVALQKQRHFRYPLPDLVGKRVTDQNADGGDVC